MLDSIERDIYIEAPVDHVWELVTQAQHLGRWFGDAGAEVDLRPGGKMNLTWREHGTVLGRVEAVERPHRFAYTWAAGTDTDPVPGRSTRVELSLASEGDGTRVRVVESGFASLDEPEAAVQARYDDHVEGWQIELAELGGYASNAPAGAR